LFPNPTTGQAPRRAGEDARRQLDLRAQTWSIPKVGGHRGPAGSGGGRGGQARCDLGVGGPSPRPGLGVAAGGGGGPRATRYRRGAGQLGQASSPGLSGLGANLHGGRVTSLHAVHVEVRPGGADIVLRVDLAKADGSSHERLGGVTGDQGAVEVEDRRRSRGLTGRPPISASRVAQVRLSTGGSFRLSSAVGAQGWRRPGAAGCRRGRRT